LKFLLTGFEAFDQSTINPSAEIVKAITADPQYATFVQTLILPVDTKTAPPALMQTIKLHQPDVILCLGEAAHRPVVSIERVALNLLDFRIPDNSGVICQDEAIIPYGPAAYFSTIPVRQIFQNLLQAGIPAELSLSAGTYLCNQILYTVLHQIAVNQSKQTAGFIHVPSLPQQVVEKNKVYPSMALETSLSAVKQIINTILDSSKTDESVLD
jgi:pyroglutamyl-peptidase